MKIAWTPGIGDPTVTAWLTVVAYCVAALLSFRAALLAKTSKNKARRIFVFWLCVALLSLCLGVNKQLDIQSLLTAIAKLIAKEHGWYVHRRSVQTVAVGILILTGGAVLIGLLSFLRRAPGELRVASVGLTFIVCFVCVRAASFHRVDIFISHDFYGLSWSTILELPGVLLIAGAATVFSTRKLRSLEDA